MLAATSGHSTAGAARHSRASPDRHAAGCQRGLLNQAFTVRSRRFLFLDYIKARATA